MKPRATYFVVLSWFCAWQLARAAGVDHWSLRPLAHVNPPSVKQEDWCRTPIDRFIAGSLEARAMKPSESADKRTLIRRAYYDLIGLPPSPQEVNAFVNDSSPDAFGKVVDSLLDSPEYGERWARHWLDVAHYAETHGHDQDRPRTNSWPYRDYVIRSFNEDKPYPRFVQEQVAGDVLFADDPQATVAMGFLATGPWDESSLRDIREDSIDRQIARYIDRDDIVTTVMNTFVSTTVQCARCHDHKFDPVSQREYYNLQAVFAGTEKANRVFDSDPKIHLRRQALLRQQRALREPGPELQEELLAARGKIDRWETAQKFALTEWETTKPIACTSSNGSALKIENDGSVSSSGQRPETDTYTIYIPGAAANGLRLELLSEESLPKKGPGRQDNGNLHLTDFHVYAVHSDSSISEVWLKNPVADFNQEGWDIAKAIDADPKTGWGIFPQVGRSHQAFFEFTSSVLDAEQFKIVLAQDHGGGHLIGRLRFSLTTSKPPFRIHSLPDDILAVLRTSEEGRTRDQRLALALYVARAELEQELNKLPKPELVYAGAHDFVPDASHKPIGKMREVRLLKRGDINKPGNEAVPGALESLAGLKGTFQCDGSEASRRAALARWLTDRANVLTWRSIVNRVWHYHFGRGIVNTPNDFGKMGGLPSHPELLDWLANWFYETGGSLKRLHKLILTSAVYQQSSKTNPDYAAVDSDNTMLWRMNRARLEAENVRDTILYISGTLDPKMGGPSAQQFLMAPGIHVTPKVDYTGFDIDRPEVRRRSVYRFVFRTLPDPMMDALDCPDSSQLTAVRNSSVTVSQALAMLNDQFVTRYSEHFASSLAEACPGDLDAQISRAINLAFCRTPTPGEIRQFRAFAEKNGLPNFCRVLFNSNEFMFIN